MSKSLRVHARRARKGIIVFLMVLARSRSIIRATEGAL
jgi:hypothetical protein